MPRELSDYIGRHRGETAWLFGKGPSLDRFDLAQAGPLRCAINDVVGRIPGCRYAFANDAVTAWAHLYAPGQVLFQPRRLAHDPAAFAAPLAAERVLYADEADDARLDWPPERLAREGLAIRRGTLGSAGQILRLMGVARVVCVGIDGGGRHASGTWLTELRPDHAADYNAIRDAFIAASHRAGLPVEFFGAPVAPHVLPDGMTTIRLLDSIFIAGVPVAAGEIHTCPPAVAAELVGAGRAHYCAAPAAHAPASPVAEVAALAAPSTAPARTAAPTRRPSPRTARPVA